jgi:hypothetical protein
MVNAAWVLLVVIGIGCSLWSVRWFRQRSADPGVVSPAWRQEQLYGPSQHERSR